MADQHKDRIKIPRKHEVCSNEIATMISEGGLGADKYYEIDNDMEGEDFTESISNNG
ncbi:hypothetical protein QR721_04325 [Aciduricibacillus chroicocephali]|uniref:Uncharacterized protein n=1 Tax=Aciduricibacillus chroicocephali TaxID=3054939 RepID=A0ABY9KXT2_9BACI|nr:hypothetical protein QR721_04325 [Bacillaceae bacterium 44XB]